VSPGFGIAGWVSLLLAAFGTVAVFFTVLLAIGKRRRGPVVQVPHPAELDAEARRLLRPIRQLHERLRELESSLGDVPEFRVLAREAVQESDHLLTQAVRLTETRAGLLRVLKGRVEAESQAFRLQREIEASQDDTERASLESALAARQSEIASYDERSTASNPAFARPRPCSPSSKPASRLGPPALGPKPWSPRNSAVWSNG
jgi:hypothetical protein